MRPIRVLIAKPGVDGHDVGAKLVCRALMDVGMNVAYTGLRKSPEEIAKAALAHEADVVGLSIMSGAHLVLAEKVKKALDSAGVRAKLLVGGVIPSKDVEPLRALGANVVFGVGSSLDDVVAWVKDNGRPA